MKMLLVLIYSLVKCGFTFMTSTTLESPSFDSMGGRMKIKCGTTCGRKLILKSQPGGGKPQDLLEKCLFLSPSAISLEKKP